MTSTRTVGRVTGALLLLQFACGLMVPFIITQPFTGAEDLAQAAQYAPVVRTSVLLWFASGVLTLGIAITLWPELARRSQRHALWLLMMAGMSCALEAVHSGSLLALLSASQRFADAGTTDAALAAVVGSARKWAHFTQLAFTGGWIFTFYLAMLRFAFVPRWLAALGLAGIVAQFTGVTLPGLLGLPLNTVMAMPLAPIHVTTAGWLLVKGLSGKSEPLPASPRTETGQ